MSTALVWLSVLMGAVTYPWRAIPLLAPGLDRLAPTIREYLRLVGPAMLATLAAVTVAVAVDASRSARTLHVGPEWIAVAACVVIVALKRGLLLGLIAAAGSIAVLRALGWA
jgi:branched-subunit amino acid transport protein